MMLFQVNPIINEYRRRRQVFALASDDGIYMTITQGFIGLSYAANSQARG